MSILEEKIRKNKELFETAEPSPGHFDKFREKLDVLDEVPQTSSGKYGMLRRIAASFLLLVSLGIALYFLNQQFVTNQVNASQLPPEIMEVKMYYNKEVTTKLEKIEQCASTPKDASTIRQMVQGEFTELEKNTQSLEQEFSKNNNNERVKNALILNYKTKSELLDDILSRLCRI